MKPLPVRPDEADPWPVAELGPPKVEAVKDAARELAPRTALVAAELRDELVELPGVHAYLAGLGVADLVSKTTAELPPPGDARGGGAREKRVQRRQLAGAAGMGRVSTLRRSQKDVGLIGNIGAYRPRASSCTWRLAGALTP